MDKYGLAIYNENRVKKRLSTYLDCGGLASVIFPEQENKDVIRVKSSKFTVTAKEEIPWVLDGEFGGSVTEAKIENVKEAVTLSCSPEPEKQEEKTAG